MDLTSTSCELMKYRLLKRCRFQYQYNKIPYLNRMDEGKLILEFEGISFPFVSKVQTQPECNVLSSTSDDKNNNEIPSCIAQAKMKYYRMKTILTCNYIITHTHTESLNVI